MKTHLWQPLDEADRAFQERCRRWALPIAGGLGFVMLALLLWSVAKLTETILNALG
jgi:hypothetical protein